MKSVYQNFTILVTCKLNNKNSKDNNTRKINIFLIVRANMTFRFDKSKLLQAEQDYSRVKLSPKQKETVHTVAKIHAKNLKISELAARGFITYTISDWQKENKVTAETYYVLSHSEQRNALKRMSLILFEKLSRIVPKNEHARLKKSVMDAYDVLISAYKLNTTGDRLQI